MMGWLLFALLCAFALGYAVRQWFAEWKAPTSPPAAVSPAEWNGEVAGFDNAYNVRVLPDE